MTVSAQTVEAPLYQADFESPAFVAGSIDGQRGWAVDQGRAEVTAGQGINGSTGLVLVPLEPFSQARLRLKYPEGPDDGVTFVDLYVRPVAGAADSREEIIDVNSARIGLFRTEDPKMAAVWVFDAAASGAGQWLRTGARMPVDERTGRCADWHRLTLREDAVRRIWDVWVDGVWTAANVGFEEERRQGEAVYIFMGDRSDVISLDELSISAGNPLAADADRDGLPDDLERKTGSDPGKDDRDEELAGDGVSTVGRAAAAGDPVVLARKALPAAALAAPVVSLESGLLDQPATARWSSAAAGGEIFYTLDGSDPRTSGVSVSRYEAPLEVGRSTVCRAAVKLPGGEWSAVGASVWIFPAQVASQERPAGWPEAFTDVLKGNFGENRFPVPYDMVPDGKADFTERMAAALRAAPVVSLTVDPVSFFEAQKGIYHRAGSLTGGPAAQTVVRVLEGDLVSEAVEAKVRISGESSRHHEVTLKHSLRLSFEPGAVRIPGMEGTGSSVLLRHPTQDSWAVGGRWADLRPTARYYADGLADRVLAEAGHPHLSRRYVHVFLNSCYWGVYEAVDQVTPSTPGTEKNALSADALVNAGDGLGAKALFGDVGPWALLIAQARQTAVASRDGWGTEGMWDHLLERVDVPGLIDYMLVNLWLGNADWPERNWLITHQQGKFGFLSWDAEMVMPHKSKPRDILQAALESTDGPAGLFSALCWSPAFRTEVKARLTAGEPIWFNDAAFTSRAAELAEILKPLLPAEAARWGSFYEPQEDLMALWERENAWVAEAWAPGRAQKLSKPLLNYLHNLETRIKAAAEEESRKKQGPVPFVVTTPTLRDGSLDSDGDGMPDAWETAHGLDPFDPSDSLGDLDGDGLSNLLEYKLKTDPAKANPAKLPLPSALTGTFTRPDRPIIRAGVVRDALTAGRLGLLGELKGLLKILGTSGTTPETPSEKPAPSSSGR